MGSPFIFHLEVENSQAINELKKEAIRLETKYSRYLSNSITSQINQSAGSHSITPDAETAGLLNYAAICYEQSEGLFDITTGVYRQIWNFKSGQLPTNQAINELQSHIGWSQVQWDGTSLFLPSQKMELDFGGVVKEYAADRLASLARHLGITSGLLDLGGDMVVIGPKKDESPWMIGIRNPKKPNQAIATIPMYSGAVATSGNYERFMMVEGQRYCHIINPLTGWPVRDCASASVFSDQCLVSGSMATIAMLKQKQAANWLKAQEAQYLVVYDDGHCVRSK